MWFFFGLMTLISFSIYFGYRRLNAAWSGQPSSTGNVPYQYRILRNKRRPLAVWIGIRVPKGYDFALKKENPIDRFFKLIKLSAEHQTGDSKFDELVYVVSDNEYIHYELSNNSNMRQAVLGLFNSGNHHFCHVKEIRHSAGRLWIRYKIKSGFEEDDVTVLADKAVPLLKKMANCLKQSPVGRHPAKRRDPFVVKAAIILAISSGLAVNGLVHIMRLLWSHASFTIDSVVLFESAVYVGLIFSGVLIVTAVLVLGRSARTHLVLIELLLIGTFGAVTTAFIEMRDLNMAMDNSPSVVYQSQILDKHVSRGNRSTSYYIDLDDWTNEDERKSIEVSGSFYDKASIGDYLVLNQKPGYLGYRWVEKYELKTAL